MLPDRTAGEAADHLTNLETMNPFTPRSAASLILLVPLIANLHADTPQATYDQSTGRATITEAGKPILVYPYKAVPVPDGFFDGIPEKHLPYARKYAIPRSNYIHPLFGPDGVPAPSG